ncbi:MAG: DEAD/DEAH box helicase [Proteobacteria bacterium]|nr:DEAD/DEAH box helicase [Pseudomonadota bacterium]MBU4469034.1 DEAD/DEAH box helicase [Pseudomonadota bacterium]MCG2753319.1 DEAD/DEAH box helicase [Desulfobacteraceae bacterium]
MNQELILTPAGRLRLRESDPDSNTPSDPWMKRVAAAFLSSMAAGLFTLAAARTETPLSSGFAFWRDFAGTYLTQLCRNPPSSGNRIEPVTPPVESELAILVLSAPPMQGGEYLRGEVFSNLWAELDVWTREQIAMSSEGLGEWLKKHAPLWRQVGRVCFHLAENKRDPEFPFAFLATYAPGISKAGQVQYQPLGKALQEYAGEKNKKALINLLSPVQMASEKVGFVKELVDSGDIFHPLAWTPAEAYRVLKNAPLLEESGLLVKLPDWWRKRPRPRVSVSIGEKSQSRFGMDAMLDFKVRLTLGDDSLTEKEWRDILASEDGLAYVKGQWVEVDREKLSEALSHWKQVEADAASGGLSFIEGMRLLAGAPANLEMEEYPKAGEQEWSFVNAGKWLSEVLSSLRNPEGLMTKNNSADFQGVLRHYQEVGRDWLWFLSQLGLGACLADDMGLGKTVQVLALLLAVKENAPAGKASLLVLPASLISNWKAEIARFAPNLEAVYIHPSETDKATLEAMAGNPGEALSGVQLALTTYGMLARQKWLLDIHWRMVILDEAQAVKNPSARQTKTVKKLKADARIALTGTPVENRISDLWSLFDFLSPGLLGSAAVFKRFVKGLESGGQDRYAPLRNLVQPYILRRLKTDKSIISDLPDKTEMKAFCGLAKKQAALYARSVEELGEALHHGVDGIKRRGLVLSFLMRFKQICNHPSQFLGDGGYEPDHSGKFDRLRTLCEEISSRQEKVIVFTQFREMTRPIAGFLGGVFGREGLVLHGGTEVKKRKMLIDRFQEEDGPPFFVLSLKAGGTGLNLTAANHVIHFDRWWNPAVETQATDRAFRIGQHRNVLVHKFICRGTIEEKIDELIEEKLNLADDILKTGAETLLTEMSNEALLKIVALDIDRAEV